MEDKEEEDKPKSPTVEPLTKKQELNNHIVLMRKEVRRARLYLINKLAKEVKKLKEHKGTGKAKEKAIRKAERLLQEIQIIKHLKADKVSIFALLDSKTEVETLQNPKSTTEERSLSRLGHQSFVKKEVTKYRESNPHWKLQIPVLLERSKDKRRKIDKKLREREAAKLEKKSPQTVLLSNNSEDDEKSDNSEDSEEESENSGSDIDDEEEEPEVKTEEIENKDSTGEGEPDIPKLLTKPAKAPYVKKVKVTVKKVTAPAKKKSPADSVLIAPRSIGKSQGTVRVQLLNNLSDLEQEQIPSSIIETNIKLTSEDPDQVPKKRPRSSFFVGGEDEPESDKKEEQQQQQHQQRSKLRNPNSDSTEFKPIFRKGKLVNKGPKRFNKPPQGNQRGPSRYFQDKGGADFSSNLIPLGDKKESKDNFPKSSKNTKNSLLAPPSFDASGAEKLHPSWEAKKRQQISLSGFQGKKITFGEDE